MLLHEFTSTTAKRKKVLQCEVSASYQSFFSLFGQQPNRGQSPVEWDDFPSIHQSVSQVLLAGFQTWLVLRYGLLVGSEAWQAG